MAWGTIPMPVTGTAIATTWGAQVKADMEETATAKLTTAGDLPVASGPNAITRLPAVAVGQVLKSGGVGAYPVYGQIVAAEIADGQVTAAKLASGAAPIANTSSETGLGANYTPTASYTDVLSIALAAGEWVLWATVLTFYSGAGLATADLRLLQTTGSVVLAEALVGADGTNIQNHTSPLLGRVVLAGADTVKLQIRTSSGTGWTVRSGLIGGANQGTKIVAMRVA